MEMKTSEWEGNELNDLGPHLHRYSENIIR